MVSTVSSLLNEELAGLRSPAGSRSGRSIPMNHGVLPALDTLNTYTGVGKLGGRLRPNPQSHKVDQLSPKQPSSE